MRETAPKERDFTGGKTSGDVSMPMRLAKLIAGRKRVMTAHTGGVSQIVFADDDGGTERTKKTFFTQPPQGFTSGNGCAINSRPTAHLIGDGTTRSYETETHSAYRPPSPSKDTVRFKLYLVRDECHTDTEYPADQPLNAWQSRKHRKANPFGTSSSRFSTICSTTMPPPSKYDMAADKERIARQFSENPSLQNLDLRSKLAYLSGRPFRSNRPHTSFSRSVPGVCDPEMGVEKVANPMLTGSKMPAPSVRLETEGQQRASMAHSIHTAQSKGNLLFGATERRLVKNPPFCRDGIHPPVNSELQIDGTLPENPPPNSPNGKIWGHLLESERRGFGGQPPTGFPHKLRGEVKYSYYGA
eukprot:TRINITY_DN19885_c0_g1_i3.p1 TRINITY_DN19885_c0_g1~~TRINITY_DN19885_c0_g1_i3.p1  ORF type:complete len:418 (+),score=49.87 TRINITY_DN19885_c0_g1_i3:184-1254(+)